MPFGKLATREGVSAYKTIDRALCARARARVLVLGTFSPSQHDAMGLTLTARIAVQFARHHRPSGISRPLRRGTRSFFRENETSRFVILARLSINDQVPLLGHLIFTRARHANKRTSLHLSDVYRVLNTYLCHRCERRVWRGAAVI